MKIKKIIFILIICFTSLLFAKNKNTAKTNIIEFNNKNIETCIKNYIKKQLPKIFMGETLNVKMRNFTFNNTKVPFQKWFALNNNDLIYYLYVPYKLKFFKNSNQYAFKNFSNSYVMQNPNKVIGNNVFQIPDIHKNFSTITIVLYQKEITNYYNEPLYIGKINIKKIINKAKEKKLNIYEAIKFFQKKIKQTIFLTTNSYKINIKPIENIIYQKYLLSNGIKCPIETNNINYKNTIKQLPWESNKEFKKRIRQTNELLKKCYSIKKKFIKKFNQLSIKIENDFDKNINNSLLYIQDTKAINGLTIYLLNKYIGQLRITEIKRDYKSAQYTFLKIKSQKINNQRYFINSFFKLNDPTGFFYELLKILKNKKGLTQEELKLFDKKYTKFNNNSKIKAFSLLNIWHQLKFKMFPILGIYNEHLKILLISEYYWPKHFYFLSPIKESFRSFGNLNKGYYFIPKKYINIKTKKIQNKKMSYYLYSINVNCPIKRYKTFYNNLEQAQNENISFLTIQGEGKIIKQPKINFNKAKIFLDDNIMLKTNVPYIAQIKEKNEIKFPKWFLKIKSNTNIGYGYDKNLNKAILKAKENLLIQANSIVYNETSLETIKGNFVDYQVMKNKIRIKNKLKNKTFKIIKQSFKNGYWFIALKERN